MERSEGRLADRSRLREASVRSIGLRKRTVAIDREPGVERTVLPLGNREMGLDQLARGELARTQAVGLLVRGDAGRIGDACHYWLRLFAEDRGDDDEITLALRRIRQRVLDGK